MASFGVEAIRYFSHARAAGYGADDLSYTFNRANGFDSKLRAHGHQRQFYWANTDCWETDIRDSDGGGDDGEHDGQGPGGQGGDNQACHRECAPVR